MQDSNFVENTNAKCHVVTLMLKLWVNNDIIRQVTLKNLNHVVLCRYLYLSGIGQDVYLKRYVLQ